MPRPAFMRAWGRRASQTSARGLRHGYRSGLENKNAEHIKANGHEVRYEKKKVPYLVPEKRHTYTPDFELDNGIIVETKGIFEPTDRAKHLFIKMQHPELDVRFVFTNPDKPIYKGSPTTYAMWCEKHGFRYAKGLIPIAWFKERKPRPLKPYQKD